MAGDYRSSVDERAGKAFGGGAVMDSMDKLAEMLQKRQQIQQQQEYDLLKQKTGSEQDQARQIAVNAARTPEEIRVHQAQGEIARQNAEYQKQLAKQQQQEAIEEAIRTKQRLEAGGKGKSYKVGLTSGGGVDISENQRDQFTDLLKMQQMQALQDERDRKAIQDLEDRSTKAGTAQIIPALKRVEESVPGVTSGQAKFKSVGGIKNLAPNFSVGFLEKLGIMAPGSANERAAMQELANTKIYDSSGKQINEAEMQRIKEAMGLTGLTQPDTINQAMKQVGDTAYQKQQQVTAGAKPSAVQTFKKRGGLAGFGSLSEMLGQPQPGASPTSQETPEQRYLRLKQKYGR